MSSTQYIIYYVELFTVKLTVLALIMTSPPVWLGLIPPLTYHNHPRECVCVRERERGEITAKIAAAAAN